MGIPCNSRHPYRGWDIGEKKYSYDNYKKKKFITEGFLPIDFDP